MHNIFRHVLSFQATPKSERAINIWSTTARPPIAWHIAIAIKIAATIEVDNKSPTYCHWRKRPRHITSPVEWVGLFLVVTWTTRRILRATTKVGMTTKTTRRSTSMDRDWDRCWPHWTASVRTEFHDHHPKRRPQPVCRNSRHRRQEKKLRSTHHSPQLHRTAVMSITGTDRIASHQQYCR